jgi:hypothetical protein
MNKDKYPSIVRARAHYNSRSESGAQRWKRYGPVDEDDNYPEAFNGRPGLLKLDHGPHGSGVPKLWAMSFDTRSFISVCVLHGRNRGHTQNLLRLSRGSLEVR